MRQGGVRPQNFARLQSLQSLWVPSPLGSWVTRKCTACPFPDRMGIEDFQSELTMYTFLMEIFLVQLFLTFCSLFKWS